MASEINIAFAAIAGPACALICAGLASTLGNRRRGAAYRREKQEAVQLGFELPKLVPVSRSDADAALERVARTEFRREHDLGKRFQNDSIAHLFAASASLLVAFVSTTIGLTLARESHFIHLFAASLDVTALAIVIWAYRRSNRARVRWLRQRCLTEFVRQWIGYHFLTGSPDETFPASLRAFRDRAEAALAGERDLMKAALDLGAERIAAIPDAIATASALDTSKLRNFLQVRVVNQAFWFARSQARISRQQSRRASAMIALFAIALGAAILEVIGVLLGNEALVAWAIATMLLCIGLATASTSSYVGQNSRSLRHRYAAQMRSFEVWARDHQRIFEIANANGRLRASDKATLARAFQAFEAMMMTELIDWIAITEHDSMEIAPI